MIHHQKIRDSFHRAASRYDQYAVVQRAITREVFTLSRVLFTEDMRVLDAGCGTGYFHELARSHQQYYTLVQCDIAYGMCCLADSYASSPPFGATFTVNADMEALPFSDAQFNGVVSSLAMQWCDAGRFIKEAARMLAPGGALVVATLGENNLQELRASLKACGLPEVVYPYHPWQDYSKLLAEAGFRGLRYVVHRPLVWRYASATALFRSVKSIGGSYKGEREQRLTRSGLAALQEYYQAHYGEEEGVPATWDAVYIVAYK